MAYTLPHYIEPDFSLPKFQNAPLAAFKPVTQPGVAPENYHATAIFPEYYHIRQGKWALPRKSRMDCVVVREPDDALTVKEFRNLKPGDMVACGRTENAEEGIYLHTEPFGNSTAEQEKFAFRTRMTRESSFSIDYDELYELLEYERDHGNICWVLGPAVVFDHDSRHAMAELISTGYVHGLLAGNALATHDIECSFYTTALGQEIYTKRSVSLGHYHHLDALNRIRGLGSMEKAVQNGTIKDGVMKAVIDNNIPYVLAGSIRDDGPMPEVLADAYVSQDAMRAIVQGATTVIAMATQLHSIAVGNMTPSYTILDDGSIRPVNFYSVDMSEFVINKLANRGSLSARSILTNVQDFIVTTARGLHKRSEC